MGFFTARREDIDGLLWHSKESIGLDSKVLELLEQEWLSEVPNYGEERLDALRGCIENMSEESFSYCDRDTLKKIAVVKWPNRSVSSLIPFISVYLVYTKT